MAVNEITNTGVQLAERLALPDMPQILAMGDRNRRAETKSQGRARMTICAMGSRKSNA